MQNACRKLQLPFAAGMATAELAIWTQGGGGHEARNGPSRGVLLAPKIGLTRLRSGRRKRCPGSGSVEASAAAVAWCMTSWTPNKVREQRGDTVEVGKRLRHAALIGRQPMRQGRAGANRRDVIRSCPQGPADAQGPRARSSACLPATSPHHLTTLLPWLSFPSISSSVTAANAAARYLQHASTK
jgi:hypothetical protein